MGEVKHIMSIGRLTTVVSFRNGAANLKSPSFSFSRHLHFVKSDHCTRSLLGLVKSRLTCSRLVLQCRSLRKQTGGVNLRPKHKKDGVPSNFELIYQQKDEFYVRMFTPAIIAVYTVVAGLAGTLAINYFLKGDQPSVVQLYNYSFDSQQVVILAGFIVPIVLFYTVSLLRNVAVRIYLDPTTGEYVTVLLRYGFLKKKLKFTLADIEARPKLTRVNRSNLKVKGTRFHISEESFAEFRHYNLLLGYDLQHASEHKEMMHKDDVREFIQKGVDSLVEKEDSKFKQKFYEKRKMKR